MAQDRIVQIWHYSISLYIDFHDFPTFWTNATHLTKGRWNQFQSDWFAAILHYCPNTMDKLQV
jgi:hypothetical protein